MNRLYNKWRKNIMIKLKSSRLTNILLICLIAIICIGAAKEYKRITNLRVKGWLFGDKDKWCGLKEWENSAKLDTIVCSGIDTTCMVFITGVDSTYARPLSAYICRNGDSIFVKSDSSLTSEDAYNWMVIRP
jgi:hypothetical protein